CYEMLTGFVPFETTNTMELVHCHIAKTPVPVDKINPNVPPIISDIVIKLMSKTAEGLYQSAFGLKADLEHCLALSKKVFGKKLSAIHFELAQNDFSGKFQIPQKLYGRENEVNRLLQAFKRIANPSQSSFIKGEMTLKKGGSELMLVAGYSGVGKTALVHEVHKPMTSMNGYFVAGKFDQLGHNIPYSALSQAFNSFCQYLLTETLEILNQWREKIIKAVGTMGQVLIDVMPQLELVIGPQPAVEQIPHQEAQNRFNLVFQNFLQVFCQKEHPLILFIDDLQWADSASLNLLTQLMMDTKSHYFLIIGAYRDNEVNATHPLMRTVNALQEAEVTLNTIVLQNLSENDVNRLIAESLNCDVVLTQELTQLVYEKTQGNAFFTHEFLKSLYEEGLLAFELKTRSWQWDVKKIAALDITDNVVELLSAKIEQLPLDTIEVLKLASCIGNQFDLKTLSIISEYAQADTLTHLWSAINEGLILPLDNNYKWVQEKHQALAFFKFLHDRVQQAAYALIDEAQKKTVHLSIGRLLLDNSSLETEADKLFKILNHLKKNTQKQLIEAEKMASLGGLVAGVAHEINTPVGVSFSASSFLEQETKDFLKLYQSGKMKRSDLNAFLDTVSESSALTVSNLKRSVELINSFKQVAVDQTTEEKRTFNLKRYLDEILLNLRPKLKQTQHHIDIQGDDNLSLNSYPGTFSQIITNLVMNSLIHAYEKEEAGTLTLNYQTQADKVILQYQDDGKGMPPDVLSLVFDPFFTTNRSQGGTGLGLHIVYNLVTQKIKGEISVESQVGKGIPFRIELPF
ncbi:MAG: AAA family ATPase, partial [Candidatus Parabeggiatoa sp.]|nr:AAA family ATPase [Candidatus Parabeggiatoa sp.]